MGKRLGITEIAPGLMRLFDESASETVIFVIWGCGQQLVRRMGIVLCD